MRIFDHLRARLRDVVVEDEDEADVLSTCRRGKGYQKWARNSNSSKGILGI